MLMIGGAGYCEVTGTWETFRYGGLHTGCLILLNTEESPDKKTSRLRGNGDDLKSMGCGGHKGQLTIYNSDPSLISREWCQTPGTVQYH